jgi:hypothetical protein
MLQSVVECPNDDYEQQGKLRSNPAWQLLEVGLPVTGREVVRELFVHSWDC